MSQEINNIVVSATKWSVITEILSKLIAPVSTMILARLLTPEAFGVLVTATMVISFAEIFTDAGFQKYIIQHQFKDEDSLFKSIAVAFWSNLIFSIILWVGIIIYSSEIARLVGNKGYGFVIAVTCICIPLAAFSSIQMALFKRKFDFKTLFLVRIIGILVPLFVTIPLAFLTRSYWSLIIGMIALNVSNAIVLTWKSPWKPKWYYNKKIFREMFSFSMWSMFEAISIWLTGYLDVFIVGTMLSTYHMGVYRISITTVAAIMSIITSATTPVLFSALSLLQNDDEEFKRLFFKFQKTVGFLVFPIGVGIFLFRDLIVKILLGPQWTDAAYFIGWWGLTSSITIVLSHYSSEVYRSKGKPKFSVISQCVHLCFLIPTVLIAVNYGFDELCLSRSLVRFSLIVINLFLLYTLVRVSPFEMIKNIRHSFYGSFIMGLVYFILPDTTQIWIQMFYIVLCTFIYMLVSLSFKEERAIILRFKQILIKR